MIRIETVTGAPRGFAASGTHGGKAEKQGRPDPAGLCSQDLHDHEAKPAGFVLTHYRAIVWRGRDRKEFAMDNVISMFVIVSLSLGLFIALWLKISASTRLIGLGADGRMLEIS